MYNLALQAWDRDFFASNDMIGEASIDLKYLFEDVVETHRQFSFSKKYYEGYLKEKMGAGCPTYKFQDEDSFWVPVSKADENGVMKEMGQVRISLDVVPQDLAEQSKVGDARSDPNQNPYLPPPVGRISFTLNPFKMLAQLVGPELRRKIYCCCCMMICCALCLALFPLVFSNLVSMVVAKMFGLQ